MTHNGRSGMKSDDALEDTLDFREIIESLLKSRPDLADPDKLDLFEKTLHRQLAIRGSTPEGAQARAMDAIAAAERVCARKFVSFATTVGGGGAVAMITSILAPGAPLPVIVGMGFVGLVATMFGAPRLDRWAERRQKGRRRLPA